MQKLRCWVGCVAVVTKNASFPENLGLIVEVEAHCPIGSAIFGEHSWQVRALSRAAISTAGPTNHGFIPDSALTPITPPDGFLALTDKIIDEATA